MRVLAIISLLMLLSATGSAQTTKPKPVAAKPKTVAAKPKVTADSKIGKAVSKITSPKPSPSKNNPIAPNPSAKKPKAVTTASKQKAVLSPEESLQKEADEEAEYQKASTIPDGSARIAALQKFIKSYPNSKRTPDAEGLLVTVQSQLGNDKLVEGDIAGAVSFFRAAISDAPSPMPDVLFADTFAKFPANVYFRGARTEGFDLARSIEEKCSTVIQLLSVANFYMSIENGSEARRVAENALKVDAASSPAHQTLGLANRMDFLLDESATAYAKALELDSDSISARRGLAEMKRALAKSDEAVVLYREILAKDEADLPARTGLVLALFDAGKRTDAEAELARSLEANPGNVILQAGAAYWYASNNEGEKATDLAQKAIANDPRFIWSHIALARGYIARRDPISAEKTLLAARRYGNFPTLEYEIAWARANAGFYREAAEELSKSFSVKDGLVYTNLGGRVNRGSKDLAELVGFERRASIFAPASAEGSDNAARLAALLSLKQELDKSEPDAESVSKAADAFVAGDDKMKVHRVIFASSQLLDKKVALAKVIELTRSAPTALDAGLEVADPSAAVMASELYESRIIAATRGDYVNLPPVPRQTLSSVLRGRVEEISGWAHFQLDDAQQATVHLKRAVSVLPVDSAWWRSSTWRLGTSLLLEGKNAEALDMYLRSYKSGPQDALKYSIVENLYRRVNGNTMGLENRIGANPNAPADAEVVSPRPTSTPSIPIAVAKQVPTPEPTPSIAKTEEPEAKATPQPEIAATSTPEVSKSVAAQTPTPVSVEPTPSPSPTTEVSEAVKPLPEKSAAEPPVVQATQTPESVKPPEPSPTPMPVSTEAVSSEPVPVKVSELPSPTPTPEQPKPTPTPEPAVTTVAKETTAATKLIDGTNGLFPPVIISIPPPASSKITAKAEAALLGVEKEKTSEEASTTTQDPPPSPAPQSVSTATDSRPRLIDGVPTNPEGVVKPCSLTLDQETITVQSSGIDRAVVIRRSDDGDIEGLTATSSAPQDVNIRREPIPGVKWTALFILRSVTAKPGTFQVTFEAPCGKKEVTVKVQ